MGIEGNGIPSPSVSDIQNQLLNRYGSSLSLRVAHIQTGNFDLEIMPFG